MKNIFSLMFITVVFLISALGANASYYYDDGSNDDNPNVDKFVPTSGVKIKESGLARMMENATRDAMEGKKTSKKTDQKTVKKNTNENNVNKRSYKWF